ncbi:hypothetical protein CSHISOI_07371 [Colletotrichum shisoi]|uniref:Uncharacterized protein n=1 Tax=Colletotrichum shisoi TaxID=2078593 RepID=A0A5Q4BM50_9PEZI|nr:hypothetical protein CSHISOI_07371 [Colletotrichum shisoi]
MAVPEPKPGGGEDLRCTIRLTPSPPPPRTTATTAASDRPVRPHHPVRDAVRDAVRGFSTQWFLVPRGTAVLATILHHQLDYHFRGLTVISYLFWVAAAALLLSTLESIYAARLALFPRHVLRTLRRDEVELAGLSSVSIASTSVVQMASLTLVSAWGARALGARSSTSSGGPPSPSPPSSPSPSPSRCSAGPSSGAASRGTPAASSSPPTPPGPSVTRASSPASPRGGLATSWWIFAIMGAFHAFLDGSVPKKIPYTLAGWALVFPWGVYTNAAVQLGKLLDSRGIQGC